MQDRLTAIFHDKIIPINMQQQHIQLFFQSYIPLLDFITIQQVLIVHSPSCFKSRSLHNEQSHVKGEKNNVRVH